MVVPFAGAFLIRNWLPSLRGRSSYWSMPIRRPRFCYRQQCGPNPSPQSVGLVKSRAHSVGPKASVAGFRIRRFRFISWASLDEGMTHLSSQMRFATHPDWLGHAMPLERSCRAVPTVPKLSVASSPRDRRHCPRGGLFLNRHPPSRANPMFGYKLIELAI